MSKGKNIQFKNVLAFLILMGGTEVLTKSPDYIEEKFARYIGDVEVNKEPAYGWGLDGQNKALLFQYIEHWNVDQD